MVMNRLIFLLPSLPRPPHKEWVVSSPMTPSRISTTLKSFRWQSFSRRNRNEGIAMTRGRRTRSPNAVAQTKIISAADSLKTAVARKTGE